jgi:hypothetical protein
MKVRLTIEIDLDDLWEDKDEDKLSLEEDILLDNGSLIIYSTEISEYVGIVTSVKNIKFIS